MCCSLGRKTDQGPHLLTVCQEQRACAGGDGWFLENIHLVVGFGGSKVPCCSSDLAEQHHGGLVEAVARAFAVSLLDCPSSLGADRSIPFCSVVGECCHVVLR